MRNYIDDGDDNNNGGYLSWNKDDVPSIQLSKHFELLGFITLDDTSPDYVIPKESILLCNRGSFKLFSMTKDSLRYLLLDMVRQLEAAKVWTIAIKGNHGDTLREYISDISILQNELKYILFAYFLVKLEDIKLLEANSGKQAPQQGITQKGRMSAELSSSLNSIISSSLS